MRIHKSQLVRVNCLVGANQQLIASHQILKPHFHPTFTGLISHILHETSHSFASMCTSSTSFQLGNWYYCSLVLIKLSVTWKKFKAKIP